MEERMAVLLDEICHGGSLSQASKAAGIDIAHPEEREEDMNTPFRKPLVGFRRSKIDSACIHLAGPGEDAVCRYRQKFGTV